jgi:hypothetical protein
MRRLKWIVIAWVIFSLAIGPGALAQDSDTPLGFPTEHKEFLSGAAQDLLFGPEAAAPAPLAAVAAPVARTSTLLASSSAVGPNIRVNAPQQSFPNGLLGRSETTIAASADGMQLVAGWNDAQGFCGAPFGSACTPQSPPGLSGYAYSTDGGLTWTDGGGPDPFGGVLSRGDPWLDRGGRDGKTFFYANLAVDAATGASLGLGVWRGRFTGNSFAWTDVKVIDSPRNAITPDADFYDKEAIAVDSKGNGYVSLTNFQELCGLPQFGFGQIEVWRTHDGGDTWQGPAIAGPEAPDSVADCGFSGTLQQSSHVAIGPGGEVYVTWQYGPFFAADGTTSTNAAIYFARSLNGGVTFEKPVKLADINSMRQNPPVGYNRSRINDHPRIAAVQSGWHRGGLYVVFYSAVAPVGSAPQVACPPGQSGPCFGQNLVSSQAYISWSNNRGKTWSAPVPVAPPVPPSGVKRLWPVVSLYQSRDVNVTYYEISETQLTADPADIECSRTVDGGRRVGTQTSIVDVYVVTSRDGALTFSPPVKVTTASTNWCPALSNIRPNFGDYIDARNVGAKVLTVWADARVTGTAVDTYFAAVQP